MSYKLSCLVLLLFLYNHRVLSNKSISHSYNLLKPTYKISNILTLNSMFHIRFDFNLNVAQHSTNPTLLSIYVTYHLYIWRASKIREELATYFSNHLISDGKKNGEIIGQLWEKNDWRLTKFTTGDKVFGSSRISRILNGISRKFY